MNNIFNIYYQFVINLLIYKNIKINKDLINQYKTIINILIYNILINIYFLTF